MICRQTNCGDKVCRYEHHRYGAPEPHWQYDYHIKHRQRAAYVAGPEYSAVDLPVAQQRRSEGQQKQHGKYEQQAGPAGGLLRFPVNGVRLFAVRTLYIRVKHNSAAKRALFLAVAQLNSTFYTIQSSRLPFLELWLVAFGLYVKALILKHPEKVQFQLRLRYVAYHVDIHGAVI